MVNSHQCIDWLAGVVKLLWLPRGTDQSETPPYLAMPLVIVAIDRVAPGDEGRAPPLPSSVHMKARLLADSVQAVLIEAHPPAMPKRLVMTTVVKVMLESLMYAVEHLKVFIDTDLELQEDGIK